MQEKNEKKSKKLKMKTLWLVYGKVMNEYSITEYIKNNVPASDEFGAFLYFLCSHCGGRKQLWLGFLLGALTLCSRV